MSRSFDYKIQADIVGNNATVGTINVNNINLSGNLNQNGLTFVSSQWTSNNDNSIYYTNGNVISDGLISTNISASSLNLSGDLFIGGTITTVNITTSNIIDTNISSGNLVSINGTIVNSTQTNTLITALSAGSINVSNMKSTFLTTSNLLVSNASFGNINSYFSYLIQILPIAIYDISSQIIVYGYNNNLLLIY